MYLVGTILFRADDKPEVHSAFAAAREAADAFRPQGLTHQFWGRALEVPRPFHWYLVWSGDADLAQADAALHSLVSRLPALKPPQTVFTVSVANSPVDALRAPIVGSVAWRVAPADIARASSWMDSASKLQVELNPRGLVAWCLSPTAAERGLYLGGWTSVEAHQNDLQEEGVKGERFRAASEEAYGCYETMDFYHVALVEHLPKPTPMYLVGTILFRADDTPEVRSAFAAAREAADAFRPQGLTHQFWGHAVETPRPFHWYLVWSGDTDLAQADAALYSLVPRLPALKPPQTVFTVSMAASPVDAFRAPVVASVAWRVAPANVARAGPSMDCASKRQKELAPKGLVAWCLSPTLAERGLYLGGWTSIEAHYTDLQEESEKGERYRAASEAAYGCYETMDFYHVALVEHLPRPTMMYLVGTILFRADDTPEVRDAFAAAREAADAFRPQGLTHQFWGRAFETPRPFHWYLIWSGDADLAQADAALHSLISRLPALKPPQTVFTVPVTNSPVDACRAPIVASAAWHIAPADVTRAGPTVDYAAKQIVALDPSGLVAWCLSPTVAERGLYLGGWTSLEAHQNDLLVEGEKGDRYRAASEAAYGFFAALDFYHVALVEHVPDGRS